MPSCVTEVIYSLGARNNFEHCANKNSLYRPQDALGFVARHQLEYYSIYDKRDVYIQLIKRDGGEEGIRTLGSCESLVFKTSSLNRSDTSPKD